MEVNQTTPDRLVEDSRGSLQDVRRALIELYASIGADPSQPQDVARRLGLNRNLTWKLSKVIHANDPFASLNHLPGQQGIDLASEAFKKAGAPPVALDGLTVAVRRFSQIVDRHAGDRDHFELTLESMGLFERETRPETGRELAYRGNSMIWGVQVETRFGVAMIAPHPTLPNMAEWVAVAGLVGFRRLRPTARWRLLRLRIDDEQGKTLEASTPRPLEPTKPGDPPFLIRSLCSSNLPPIEEHVSSYGRELILAGGPVGKLAAFDCYSGYRTVVPVLRDGRNDRGSSATTITLPAEMLVMDLLVHRDVPMDLGKVDFSIFGFPHGGPDDPSMQTHETLLPIRGTPVELAGSPPAVALARLPKYGAVLDLVSTELGWNMSHFRGLRVQLAHPPMSSIAVLRWPLAEP